MRRRAIAGLLCACALIPDIAHANAWRIENVALVPKVQAFTLPISLTLDDAGNPHLSYVLDGRLLHAFKVADAWTSEAVDTTSTASNATPDRSNPGARAASAFFISNCPIMAGAGGIHIAYMGGRPARLRHALKADGVWSIDTVDERASSSTLSLALALDANGNPHIAYCGYPSCVRFPCSLKHAFESSGGWSVELVDSTQTGSGRSDSGRIGGPHVVLSMNGDVPHIVLGQNHAFQYTLIYASKGTNWIIEKITDKGGENLGLDIDSHGTPHIAWAVESAIQHAWRVGAGEWRIETYFDSAEPTWSLVDIAIDAEDNVHIVTCFEAGMRYLLRKGPMDWQAETVDAEALGGFPLKRVALVLDDRGRPHIGYVGPHEV